MTIISTLAASVISLIYVGMCFGSPILSFIAQRTSSYNATIVSAGIAMLAVFTALIFECFNVNVMSICFILVGVFSAYQILAIYKVSTYVNPNFASVATALANMIIMSFGYGFHSIIGVVINYTQDDLVKAYTYGISVIPIALIIGIIGYFIVSVSKQYGKDGI